MGDVTLKHSPILTNTDDVFLQEIKKKKNLTTKYLLSSSIYLENYYFYVLLECYSKFQGQKKM